MDFWANCFSEITGKLTYYILCWSHDILFLQLWSVIEEVLLEDLLQDSFDKKTPNVNQKVILERRTHESSRDCLEHPCKTLQQQQPAARNPNLESFESVEEESLKPGEGVDIDCYLQEELDKHEQKAGEQNESLNTKSSSRQGGRIKGRCLPVVRCRQIKERALSPTAPEPKKVFRCNINNCSKTYVKSSHLKVIRNIHVARTFLTKKIQSTFSFYGPIFCSHRGF